MFEYNLVGGSIYTDLLENIQQQQHPQFNQLTTYTTYRNIQQEELGARARATLPKLFTTTLPSTLSTLPTTINYYNNYNNNNNNNIIDYIGEYGDDEDWSIDGFLAASSNLVENISDTILSTTTTTTSRAAAAAAAAVTSSTIITTTTDIQPIIATWTPILNINNNHHNKEQDEWFKTCTDVYSEENVQSKRLEFWVCGVVLNIVGILGIIGNIISMIILSRPQMRSSINYLLIGLARCDIMLIITSMLLFGIPSVYPYTGKFFYYYNNIYPQISPIVYPVAMIAHTASIYMTFTVTLERYVAVCHPLRARALCTYGRAKIYFIVCILFAIAYNLPRFWEVLTIDYKPPDSNVILHCVRPSALRRDPTYIKTYIHWCYLIINYIIPFLTLAILNCLIYRQVKRANRERQRLSRSEKREIGLATMLLCVVVVFFLFNFLALVLNISEAFYNFIDTSLTKISNSLVTINSSANFLIYVIFGEKFKRIFLLIFFKRHLSRDQPDLIHYESSISNNGDGSLNHRASGRFSRHGTQRSTTTYLTTNNSCSTTNNITTTNNSVRLTQSSVTGVVKIKRNRAPSPGPIVYYPARNTSTNTTPIIINNNTSPLDCDWIVDKNCQMTSSF